MDICKMMVTQSENAPKTQSREDRMLNSLSPPEHLMTHTDEMLASSETEPRKVVVPNALPKQTHLMSLPDEVLVLIFSFLPLTDICNNAVRVCSRWRHIGQDYAVYRNITLTEDMIPKKKKCDIEQSTVFSVIQKAVKLTSFNCLTHNTRYLNLLLQAVAKHCPDLQHLSVPRVGVSKETCETLLRKCPNVCTINICGRSLRNCSDITNFKYLRVIKFRFEYFASIELMTEYNSELFRNIIKGCLSLEELHVYWLLFDGETFQFIINKTKDRLKSLAITTSNYMSNSFTHLSSCVHLERLSLLNYTPNSASTIDLSPLRPLQNLKCLKLDGFPTMVSKNNLRELFAECTFRELRVLTILDCPFGDNELLRQVAASFPRLSILNLHGFQAASDAGLAEILTKCPILRSVRIEGFGIWTKGTCFNIHHPCLETVDMVHCDGVEYAAVDALYNNSKLHVHFSENPLSPLTDLFEGMTMC